VYVIHILTVNWLQAGRCLQSRFCHTKGYTTHAVCCRHQQWEQSEHEMTNYVKSFYGRALFVGLSCSTKTVKPWRTKTRGGGGRGSRRACGGISFLWWFAHIGQQKDFFCWGFLGIIAKTVRFLGTITIIKVPREGAVTTRYLSNTAQNREVYQHEQNIWEKDTVRLKSAACAPY